MFVLVYGGWPLQCCGGAGPGRAAGRAGWWLHCRGGLYKLLPGHLYPP